tara:strand:+ start:56 stop:283 length:228 start_codon:yes stop_codon:yes gene_type:complete
MKSVVLKFRNREVLSGDDLTKLIHCTVRAWADEEALLNSENGYEVNVSDRYYEMMTELSEECFENRNNYSSSRKY